jgi:hypothetical protein
MEEQLNNYFSEFEKLLKTKDYSVLTDPERGIVNRFSTEEEYNKIRKIILMNSEMISKDKNTFEPDPEIFKNLLNTMRSDKASSGFSMIIRNIFKYRIPAYQFAIYVAASIIIFIFIFNRGKIVTVEKPVYYCKTDTVEKIIIKESTSDVQIPPQINYVVNDQQENLNSDSTHGYTQVSNDNSSAYRNPELQGINSNIKDRIDDSRSKGRTMLDDSALVKFLVKI